MTLMICETLVEKLTHNAVLTILRSRFLEVLLLFGIIPVNVLRV